MRFKWLMPFLMLALALVIVSCGATTDPDDEAGIDPLATTETGGEDPGLGVVDETAVTTPEVEATELVTSEMDVTPEMEATEAMTSEMDVTPEMKATEAMTSEMDATPEVEATDADMGDMGSEAGINAVTFTGTEYEFDGPTSVPEGWTRFTFENEGDLPHDLQPIFIEEGRSLDDVMTALAGDGPPEWAKLYGGVSAGPGESESFLVNLEPGTYVLLSFGEGDLPDAAQGMITELTVTEGDMSMAEVELPEADVNIELVDFAFAIDDEIESREQTFYYTNTGTELHELVAFRLKEGSTIQDVQEALEREMAGEQVDEEDLPMEYYWSTMLSPGVEMYTTQEFEPGSYVLICFIPSPENDMMPHFELGMIAQVEVE